MPYFWSWRPYVPVAQRRAQAIARMAKLRKKGMNIQPVQIEGREIARTFWGRAWCDHLEKFSDYENRLPRGRTYVRNGSVCHLDIQKGRVVAKVSGSEIYDVEVTIKPLSNVAWRQVKDSCAGRVGSLLELLQGRLSDHVMAVVTDRDRGLFPRPREISLSCSCPDWAEMCKHVAAVLYGVGARLDEKPDLLFLLRGVDHTELVSEDAARAIVKKSAKTDRRTLDDSELSEVFGIDVAPAATSEAPPRPKRARRAARIGTTRAPQTARRKAVTPSVAKSIKAAKANRRKPGHGQAMRVPPTPARPGGRSAGSTASENRVTAGRSSSPSPPPRDGPAEMRA